MASSAALYFLLAAKSAKDDVQNSVTAQVMGGPPWDQGRQEDQHRDLTLARVFAVTGGAATTCGVLLLIFGSRGHEPTPTSAHFSVQPNAVHASYSGVF